MKKAMGFLILFLCSAQIYSQEFYYKPIELTKGMDLIYHSGIPIAISYMEHSIVAMTCQKNTKKSFWLHVYYKNIDSTNRVNVFSEEIKATAVNSCENDGKEIPFKVFSAYEYLKKLNNRQNWAIAIQAVGSAVQTFLAGYSQSKTNTSVNGTVYGSDGTFVSGSGNINSTTTTYDGSKAVEANYYNQQQLNQSAQSYVDNFEATESALLKSETLFPGQKVDGDVLIKIENIRTSPPKPGSFKPPKPGSANNTNPNCIKELEKINVSVPVGNEIHTFIFSK